MPSQTDIRYTLGNRLCLDFANMAVTPGEPHEFDPTWDDLIDFFAVKGILSEERAGHLRSLPETDVRAAERLMKRALDLGRGFRLMFRAMVRGEELAREWVESINRVLRVTEGHDELLWDGESWRIAFVGREEGLEWLLAAIARSGAELVAENPGENLRQCGNPQCQVLFYDNSVTHRRRWCCMSLCGNRSKVAAFAKRQSGDKARAHHA